MKKHEGKVWFSKDLKEKYKQKNKNRVKSNILFLFATLNLLIYFNLLISMLNNIILRICKFLNNFMYI